MRFSKLRKSKRVSPEKSKWLTEAIIGIVFPLFVFIHLNGVGSDIVLSTFGRSWEGLVPNLNKNSIRCTTSLRHGQMCGIPTTSNNVPTRLQSLREGTISYHGARLFNVLPAQLRNMKGSSLAKFKEKLDDYLKTVPDEPQCCGYTSYRRAASNSLLHMATIS